MQKLWTDRNQLLNERDFSYLYHNMKGVLVKERGGKKTTFPAWETWKHREWQNKWQFSWWPMDREYNTTPLLVMTWPRIRDTMVCPGSQPCLQLTSIQFTGSCGGEQQEWAIFTKQHLEWVTSQPWVPLLTCSQVFKSRQRLRVH